MIKKTLLCTVTSLIILLSSCSDNNLSKAVDSDNPVSLLSTNEQEAPNNIWTVTDGITLRLVQDSYLPGTEAMTLILENRSDSVMSYGQGWSFEKNENGIWRELETIEDYAFTSEGYTLYNRAKNTFTIPTWFLNEPFSEGLYRITGCTLRVAPDDENLSWEGDNVDYPRYQLEFIISDSASPEPDITSEKEDWQWYTPSEIIGIYESPTTQVYSYIQGANGLVAVALYDPTEHSLFEDTNLGKDIFWMDIYDRKTGSRYEALTEPTIEFSSNWPLIWPYQDGFKVDTGDLLYIFLNNSGVPEIQYLTNRINPADSIDLSGMNLYWQDDNLYFPEDNGAKLSLYVDAEKGDDGNFLYNDAHNWLLVMETSFGDYPLFPRKYLQLGKVEYAAFNEFGSDAYDIFHVLVTVRQSAGYEIYDCIFNADSKAFQIAPVYNISNINPVGGSR